MSEIQTRQHGQHAQNVVPGPGPWESSSREAAEEAVEAPVLPQLAAEEGKHNQSA